MCFCLWKSSRFCFNQNLLSIYLFIYLERERKRKRESERERRKKESDRKKEEQREREREREVEDREKERGNIDIIIIQWILPVSMNKVSVNTIKEGGHILADHRLFLFAIFIYESNIKIE